MAEQRQSPSTHQYDVVWVSAIGKEFLIASFMLDELYNDPPDLADDDENAYVFGRIGVHNVVLASLPEGRIGVEQAGKIATDVVRSFKRLRFGLMVGIAGGAPSSSHDIRLGDVVVSIPNDAKQLGGVVHYGFGANVQDLGFQRRGSLNSPPRILLSAVSSLKREHSHQGNKLGQNVEQVISKNIPRLDDYVRPNQSADHLFQPMVIHPQGLTECDERCYGGESDLVPRNTRPEEELTTVHYGTVASASTLMRDAMLRDKIAEQDGVLCFEMESAGLMNADLGWLVVRGICDYSDTHKNDIWQKYAAAVAAVYAKELVGMVRPRSASNDVDLYKSKNQQSKQDILKILRFDDMNTKERLSMPHTLYNLDWVWSTSIDAWLKTSDNLFWICGKPASGKSTVMAYLAHHKRTTTHLQTVDTNFEVIHFFYDFRAGSLLANSVSGMLRAFLYQLAKESSVIRTRLEAILKADELELDSDQFLLDLTCDALNVRNLRVCAFVDGLDEYEGDLVTLANTCKVLMDRADIKLCLASRPEFEVLTWMRDCQHIIMQHYNTSSMLKYADNKILQESLKEPRYATKTDLTSAAEKLVSEAEGVILWFKLTFDEVMELYHDGKGQGEILALVESMPAGLEALFERILGKIGPMQRYEAALILHLFEESSKQALLWPSPYNNVFAIKETLRFQSLDHLWTLYDFVAEQYGDAFGVGRSPSYTHLQHRIKTLLRGSLEVFPTTDHGSSFHTVRKSIANHFTDLSGYDVRYIHKTFASFLLRSKWVWANLNSNLRQQFPDRTLLRLAINLLVTASKDITDDLSVLGLLDEFRKGISYAVQIQSGLGPTILGKLKWYAYTRRKPEAALLVALYWFSVRPTHLDIGELDNWSDTKLEKHLATISCRIQLPFSLKWNSRYRLLRASTCVIFEWVREHGTTQDPSYAIVVPLLKSELSGMLPLWFLPLRDGLFRNAQHTARICEWYMRPLLRTDVAQLIREIAVAAHLRLWGYITDRLKQVSISPEQSQYLRQLVIDNCCRVKLTPGSTDIDTRGITGVLDLVSECLDSQDACLMLCEMTCSVHAATCARVLLPKIVRQRKASGVQRHHVICVNHKSGRGLLFDWSKSLDMVCNGHDHFVEDYSILLELCSTFGADINAPCGKDRAALQYLCQEKYPGEAEYKKFQALILAKVNPGSPAKQQELVCTIGEAMTYKDESDEQYALRSGITARLVTMKQIVEYHLEHQRWPQDIRTGDRNEVVTTMTEQRG